MPQPVTTSPANFHDQNQPTSAARTPSMRTLPRGWRGLYAVKPGRSAHPHEDDRAAANPSLCPLPRASRGVVCRDPRRRGGGIDGGEVAWVSEGGVAGLTRTESTVPLRPKMR